VLYVPSLVLCLDQLPICVLVCVTNGVTILAVHARATVIAAVSAHDQRDATATETPGEIRVVCKSRMPVAWARNAAMMAVAGQILRHADSTKR